MDEPRRKAPAVRRLKEMLEQSRRAVVFTGAGISTESGIPTSAAQAGSGPAWRRSSSRTFSRARRCAAESWRRTFGLRDTFAEASPNIGHHAVAELVRRGTVSAVITQNIDGLHQQSGVPEEKVIELHGNNGHAACLDCGERHELEVIRQAFLGRDELPECRLCGGIVKLATISFGQAMPVGPVLNAERESRECDLFIVIGSSLVVFPAAGLPVLAKRNGARLVILNREQTPLHAEADLAVEDEIGPFLSEVVGVN